ncbi:AAA domain-containing protein [Sutcliffiella halmapala]|uniref:AAA domain-containing protein n=1 Tax=Sutcliffiella halmapala TaxID=79882 RepID=UPI000994EE7C|nr:AAA domain-containing protein [Sutcliffiella halmapala]
MKKSTLGYIKEWQKALQIEIHHLKKFGSTKYLVRNGHLIAKDKSYTYFFEATQSIRIPTGSMIKLEWGSHIKEGKILSSEGKSVILSFEESLGDELSEAYIYHDPWELLDQLFERLEELKENKKKRSRVKKLMTLTMETKHPTAIIKSNVHELILRSKYNPITFVWGPPGTGKTYTLARVAANKYFKKKKVLLLSHSNQSVDVLVKEIARFVTKQGRFHEGDVLRYGAQSIEILAQSIPLTTTQLLEEHDPKLSKEKEELFQERALLKQDLSHSFSKRDSDRLLELEIKITRNLEKIRQKEVDFLKSAFIVGTTLAKAATDPAIYEKEYDVVIVDEASMAYVPQAAFAVSLGKHIIICGDFKQLPPIASARHELVDKWLREDIFHRTGVADSVEQGKLHPHLFLLKEQRRMHPAISAFTNKYIYHSLVGDHESVKENRENIAKKRPFSNSASILVHTSNTGEHGLIDRTTRSRVNLWHLLTGFQLLHEAFVDGSRSIGYVSPYRSQAVLMDDFLGEVYQQEKMVGDIIAATVHRFQGSEKDVMIFDSVDSYPIERPGMLLIGKESERLLNVAITRSKGKFIHISDTQFMRSKVGMKKAIRQLIDYQIEKQRQVFPQDIGKWVKNQHPCLQWMHALKVERVFQDLEQAKSSVVVAVPDFQKLSHQWLEMLEHLKERVSLTLISSKGMEDNFPHPIKNVEALTFPFVVVDEQILWLGTPYEGTRRVVPPYVSVRVQSTVLSQYLLRQMIL